MRNIVQRGTALGALAGAMLLATAQGAMAQSTQSPEGIGLAATGPVTISNTPDATIANPGPAPVASATVAGFVTANTISGNVSGNTTTAGIAGLSALAGAPVGVSAGAITSSCTANADGTFAASSNIANLTIPGLTIPVSPAPNTTLSLPGVVTVILNQQAAGPATGSRTVNAVVLNFPLAGETITVASSTCGPYVVTAPVPMASGTGLTIGLSTLGAAGAGIATVKLNRRRRLAGA